MLMQALQKLPAQRVGLCATQAVQEETSDCALFLTIKLKVTCCCVHFHGLCTQMATPPSGRLFRREDGSLFSGLSEPDDIETGTIYVHVASRNIPLSPNAVN